MSGNSPMAIMWDYFPVGVLLENGGVIQYCNQRMAAMLGYNPQQLCGLPLSVLLASEYSTGQSGRLFSYSTENLFRECIFLNSAGHTVELLLYNVPHQYDNGEPAIYIENVSMLTGSDTSFQSSLIADACEAIIVTSLDGSIRVWNSASEVLFGYQGAEVIGRNISLIIPPPLVQSSISRAVNNEQLERVQTFAWSKQGVLLNIELSPSPVRDQQGFVTRIAFFCRDISPEKQGEKLLQYQSRLLEAVNDAIVVAEYNGVITYWNQGAERLFGRKGEEMLGKKYAHMFDSSESKNFYTLVDEIEPGIWQGQHLIRTPQGENKHVRFSVRVLYDEAEQPDLLVAVMTDVTELVAAKLKAEEAVRARGEFLANISHEIRTPINGILGFTELLEDKELPVDQKSYLRSIKINASHLMELINDILDLSRIEANSMNVDLVAFSLRSLVNQTCQTLSPLLKEKGLTLEINYPSGFPDYFMGDNKRIRQVLNNLLSNAVKFTSRGGISVEVSFSETNHPNDKKLSVTIAVKDTGIGITTDRLYYIFEPFTQADSSTTRRYGGTGLGLAISKRLVSLMKGRLEVESTPGRGSRFSFTLPLETASQRRPMTILPEKPIPSECKLLLLTDDDVLQQYWQDNLKGKSFELVALHNELRLSALIDFYQPVAVLVDGDTYQSDIALLKQQFQAARNKCSFSLLFLTDNSENYAKGRILEADLITSRSPVQQEINSLLDDYAKRMQHRTLLPHKANILVAVHDSLTQKLVKNILTNLDYQVSPVSNPLQTRELLLTEHFDLLLLEMEMLIMEDFFLLEWLDDRQLNIPIIGLRSDPTQSHAGVHDYIEKPLTTQSILNAVNKSVTFWKEGI